MVRRALCFSVSILLNACSSSNATTPAIVSGDAGGVPLGSTPPGVFDDAGGAADATVAGQPAPGSGSTAEGGLGETEASTPTATCPTAAWNPGDSKTIAIDLGDGGLRSYDVYVGKSVKAGTAVPLLVNVHGLNNDPAIQATFSQMNPVADANGFVVVYPAGIGASFNAGSCCAPASTVGRDDVDFIRAVVADAEAKICVDSRRVYETGFSNGGMMAYQLACNASDLFAAVAPTEGENVTTTPCHPSHPVPLAAFESLGDPVVLPASAQQSVKAWAATTGCTDTAPTQTANAAFACQEWSQCSGGSKVWYCTLPGGTHLPPAGSAPVVWSFLSQFTHP